MKHAAAAQADAEYEALVQFLYLAPVGLVQASMDGEIALINPISAQLLMPLSRDGTLTNLFCALEGVAPELRHLCVAFDQPQGMICDGLYLYLHTGGRPRPAPQILSLSLMKLDESRLMAVINDVTVQVRRERQLRQSDTWLSAILTSVTDYALLGLDREGRIRDWNASIGRVTGFSEAAVGQPYSIFYPAQAMTREHLQDRLREADQNGWSLDEGTRVRADGTRFWGNVLITPAADRDTVSLGPNETAYCLVLRDISEQREASELRRKSVFCDYLTGLANRRAFFEAAEQELERRRHAPRPVALVLIDVDHFKGINDSYGHPAGDAVLRHLSIAARSTFREVDVVARIGGDEFAVLLPSTGLRGAASVAERLRNLVAGTRVAVDGERIGYTISMGVAEMDDDVHDLDALMKRADQALYASKARGRNTVQALGPDQPARNK